MGAPIKKEFLINSKFGRLTVLDTYIKNKTRYCECECDCGNAKTTTYDHLKYGYTKSCGCLLIDNAKNNFTTHGKSNHPLHAVWNTMKQRCYNRNNKSYDNYGGRGIKVCKEWLDDFMNFYNWAINNGYESGLTVDRLNANGDYEPNNCRLVDMTIQQNNRSNNIILSYKNENRTLSEWSKLYNISSSTIRKRLYVLGWSIEDALTIKVHKKKIFL